MTDTNNNTNTTTVLVPPAHARQWTTTLLQHLHVAPHHASIVASNLVLADLRGVDTHGLTRLAVYTARIQAGSLNPSPDLTIEQRTPVMARLDAQDTFGFVAAHVATEHCMAMAATFGVGITAVRNSGHLGMAGAYALQGMERGFAVVVFSNASPAMPVWGGRRAFWGTNPLAVGFPGGGEGGEEGGFLLDMSPAVVARGKVIRAKELGEEIPVGWGLDRGGNETRDPGEVLEGGTVLPIGGPKGSGIAAVVDLFGGLVTGALFAGEVRNQRDQIGETSGQGHWIMVFRPDVFLESREEYLDRMKTFLERVRSCELAPGFTQILTPGENSARIQKERSEMGIPYKREDVLALNELGARLGYGVKFA